MAELIKKTFIEILKDKNIIVPEIQREYVWGSEENIENCKKLLDDIINNISDNYNIGFLYSYEKDNKVYLIDGQQRFTTLYLTLLYLSVKENDKYKDYLNNFSYKVRNLTKEFIDLMIDKIKEEKDFFYIENKTWCLSVYKKDPTIENIINFFSIFKEDKYKKISLSNIKKAEFWYFNTSNTSQGEELYITMNSRGEKIAEYEDIRVSLLSEIKKEEYKNKAENFNKIEHFFWKHRYKGENNADEEFDKFLKQVIALSKFNMEENESNSIGDIDNIKITKNKNYLKLDDIISHYYALELLYKLLELEDTKYLTKFINKDKTINNANILNISTIIIPFLYIVQNIFEINDFNNINENTKTDLFQWLRFLYNIRFNHNSVSITSILIMIKNNNKNTYVNIFDFFECKDKNELFDYYKNYNAYENGFELLDSEINKIKLLSIYNDDISKRNDLQKLFWKLENNNILRGNIDYLIKYSFENISDIVNDKKIFIYKLKRYKKIFETCFNEKIVSRDILRKALLTFSEQIKKVNEYFESYIIWYSWSGGDYKVNKFSLCTDDNEWNESFQNSNKYKLYDTNIYYKKLFAEIYRSDNIVKKLNAIINKFTKLDEKKQRQNPFYKIINDNYKIDGKLLIEDYKYIAYKRDEDNKYIIYLLNNPRFSKYSFLEYADKRIVKNKK